MFITFYMKLFMGFEPRYIFNKSSKPHHLTNADISDFFYLFHRITLRAIDDFNEVS